MKFEKIASSSLPDIIANQIEESILSGQLSAGSKLPSERALAEQFSVSRPSIREAINRLQARDVVRKVQGDGTYISEQVGSSFADPLLDIIGASSQGLYDLLELRFSVESLSAYYAAIRGSDEQKSNIQNRFHALKAAHEGFDSDAEASADVAFHIAIAEATNNAAITHLMKTLLSVIHESIHQYLVIESSPQSAKDLLQQHKDIMVAIMQSDPLAAREAMAIHISGVEKRIADLRYTKKRATQDLHRKENLTQLAQQLKKVRD